MVKDVGEFYFFILLGIILIGKLRNYKLNVNNWLLVIKIYLY